jgi:hypothetical protein
MIANPPPPYRPAWSETDLPVKPPDPAASTDADRRRLPRYACDLLALVDPLSHIKKSTLVTHVADLSDEGIGLLSAHSYPAGAVLYLELVDRSGRRYSRMRARLIHVARHENGRWRLGCRVLEPATKAS